MEDWKKEIEKAASHYKGITFRISPESDALYDIFMEAAMHPATQFFHQQGLYTSKQVRQLIIEFSSEYPKMFYEIMKQTSVVPNKFDVINDWFKFKEIPESDQLG